eukprot:g10667.t1
MLDSLDRRQRAGLSRSNHSASHARDKDAPQPSSSSTSSSSTTTAAAAAVPSKTSSWADQWKAARSKVSAEYLKRFLKKYGRVAATFHISVFLATLGTCYTVVDYGGLDVTALVKDIPILADNLPPASAGNLAIAYGMTSAIGPPRAVLTILVTPRIAQFVAGRDAKRRDEEEMP